jgi:hypothetical protein
MVDRSLPVIARQAPIELDFRNCFVEHKDKFAGPKCTRSKTLFTLSKSGEPPAALFHRVRIEECYLRALKQVN